VKHHVSKTASACFYHIHRLRQIRHLVSREVLTQLMTSLVLSRLDYCKAVLAGLPASTLAPLQHAQNAATQLALGLDGRSHISTALQKLHWLPVKYHVTFKIATIMHQTFHHRCRLYLSDLVMFALANLNVRQLRSSTTRAAAVKRSRTQFRRRAFSVAALAYGTVSSPPSVPSTPTQPSVVC